MTRFTPFLILCRRLFIGTTAASILVSLSLGGSRAARPVFFVLVCTWIAFLCYRQYRRRACCERGRAVRCLELLGFNTSLTLILVEFSLRACAYLVGNSFLISQTLDAYRLTPGRDYGGGLRGNSLGYPGDEFRPHKCTGVYRIAALGDSFAIGPAVPFADNYLTLVQVAQPGIEVYNFGVSGAGPREYHAVLRQHAFAFQPDLVLMSIFVGNDVTESLSTPRHLHPRQYCLYRLLDRCLCLLRERWRRAQQVQAGIVDRFAAGMLAAETFREVEARRLAVCMNPAPPGLEKKWQRALGYLQGVVADCQQRHVPVACVLIPDEFQINPTVLAEALQVAQADARSLDLERPQRRLVAFFAERRVPCLDLLPCFKEVPDTYALRNTHWNVRGNRLAAERISDWLKRIREGG